MAGTGVGLRHRGRGGRRVLCRTGVGLAGSYPSASYQMNLLNWVKQILCCSTAFDLLESGSFCISSWSSRLRRSHFGAIKSTSFFSHVIWILSSNHAGEECQPSREFMLVSRQISIASASLISRSMTLKSDSDFQTSNTDAKKIKQM